MAITILVDKLPQSLHRFVVAVRVVVFFGILLLMLILGVNYAWSMRLFTIMSLNIKQTIPLMAIPVGMGLMLIEYALEQFIPLGTRGKDSSYGNNMNEEKQP